MSNQNSAQDTREVRSRIMARGPGRPAKFEKAKNPNRALVRLPAYLPGESPWFWNYSWLSRTHFLAF